MRAHLSRVFPHENRTRRSRATATTSGECNGTSRTSTESGSCDSCAFARATRAACALRTRCAAPRHHRVRTSQRDQTHACQPCFTTPSKHSTHRCIAGAAPFTEARGIGTEWRSHATRRGKNDWRSERSGSAVTSIRSVRTTADGTADATSTARECITRRERYDERHGDCTCTAAATRRSKRAVQRAT